MIGGDGCCHGRWMSATNTAEQCEPCGRQPPERLQWWAFGVTRPARRRCEVDGLCLNSFGNASGRGGCRRGMLVVPIASASARAKSEHRAKRSSGRFAVRRARDRAWRDRVVRRTAVAVVC